MCEIVYNYILNQSLLKVKRNVIKVHLDLFDWNIGEVLFILFESSIVLNNVIINYALLVSIIILCLFIIYLPFNVMRIPGILIFLKLLFSTHNSCVLFKI